MSPVVVDLALGALAAAIVLTTTTVVAAVSAVVLAAAGLTAGGLATIRGVIRQKRIYIPEHFCFCFSSNLCILNTTNRD
jgi:hypothetical protein